MVVIATAVSEADTQLRFAARLLDTVGRAVITTDLAGTITYWSKYSEVLYGWSADEVLGRNIVDVTPAMRRDEANASIAVLQTGATWHGEFPVQRRDGSTFLAHLTGLPIFDEAGALIGIGGVSYAIPTQP